MRILFVLLCLQLVPLRYIMAQEQRHIVRFGNDVVVEKGVTVEEAVAIGGNVTVNGTVDEDAVAIGGKVTVNPGGIIGQNAVAVGGTVTRGTGAVIKGDIVEVGAPGMTPDHMRRRVAGWRTFFPVFQIASAAGFLVLALLVTVLFPKAIETVSYTVEKETVRSVLWSLIGMIAIVPLAILLAVSIVGIIFIPLELVLVVAAFFTGYIAAANLLGKKIMAAANRTGVALVWRTVLGIVVLWLIGLVPVLGWLVVSLALLFGFGGVIVALLNMRQPKPVAA